MDRVIRSRERPIADVIGLLDDWSPDGPKSSFVGKVIDGGHLPTTGQKYCLVNPVDVSGPEVEGGVPTLTADTSKTVVVAMVLGTPSVGDYLICEPQGDRWVAEKQSGSGSGGPVGTIPLCFCDPIPALIRMTSVDPTCNFRMFQDCTIRFQPRPAAFAALSTQDPGYYSDESFPDPIAGGAMFNYYLTCQYNQFILSRLYPTSPYGSPFQDSILYTWLLGGYYNTCSPFHLDAGSAFPGADASCGVYLDDATLP